MDDCVRSNRGDGNGQNICWGLWGGGLHLPLVLDVLVSMEHSEGLLGTNRDVSTSCDKVLGVTPQVSVIGLMLHGNITAPWIIHSRSCGGDQPVLLALTNKTL